MKKLKIIIPILAVVILGIAGVSVYLYSAQNCIALEGDKDITLGLNGVYDEPGYTATVKGEDVTDQVKITGEVDPTTPGTYTIKYKVDSLSAERQITITDKMSPEITLEGGDITMKLGTTYDEPGYSAKDDDGNDLTAQVEVSDSNFTKAGDNQISYTVEDSNGNKTRLYRDVTVEPNTNYQTSGVPICMFHYVYDENDPPEDLHKRYGNYISTQALEEELNWLNSEGYYYPTWQEVRDYVDGKLLLPDKSIVLCFDDGAKSFLENGIPVLEKCKVPATCFMITSKDGENKIAKYQSKYVTYESHSDNMHRAGGSIGHGGIFTAISEADGLADLKKSIEICGSGDAFAYPFGDYNDSSEKMVEEAGFLCAVTTEYGKAKPGQDPLLLPRVRMSLGQSLTAFQNKVAP